MMLPACPVYVSCGFKSLLEHQEGNEIAVAAYVQYDILPKRKKNTVLGSSA